MVSVILHNIRSAHNVGAIFRTADGAGVAKVYLTGYTPAPIDRFGREAAKIAKTSLGATNSVPWEQVPRIESAVAAVRAKGAQVVAVEQSPRAIPLATFTRSGDVAYIFGNEVTGIEQDVLALADVVVEIPLLGQKESLNVAVTAGIVLFYPA